jgi:3-deoxy-D-manno-octulosonate 8-phosphate phosphatase (KDO 8-P phosphatase)
VLLDVDGVLTDGRLYFSARGEAQKVFHVRDGHGIKLLMRSGVAVAVVSGRRSACVTARMRELGVRHLVQGCTDKVEALRDLAGRLGVDPLDCACLVDDTPDLPLMTAVGFAAAVADAHPLVRSAAHWLSTLPGGMGAVRELADLLLRARAARSI